ncbi:PilN domain-containing protein [Chamaesiphon sp.]|uniref:PilN domain-containing protein n=1 Tax=Chamaesiphon sp. TaxID=2814140 RepID=UPI0035948C57
MYSLDINLLRERSEDETGVLTDFSTNTVAVPTKYDKLPLFIGIGAAALALMASGGSWFWSNQQFGQLEAKQKDLDAKLGSLKAQDARLAQLTSEFRQVSDETQSLASVFNQVQPWSAVLQDLRENVPQGVQISSVTQTEFRPVVPVVPVAPVTGAPKGGLLDKIRTPPNPEAAAKPATSVASPIAAAPIVPVAIAGTSAVAMLPADVPSSKLEITGKAKSFDEVNNFMLTLKQSAFFNPEETQLVSASLVQGGALSVIDSQMTNTNNSRRLELPKTVAYTIQTTLKRVPATALMNELDRKGAVGLVTRLRSLQQYQVIKP